MMMRMFLRGLDSLLGVEDVVLIFTSDSCNKDGRVIDERGDGRQVIGQQSIASG